MKIIFTISKGGFYVESQVLAFCHIHKHTHTHKRMHTHKNTNSCTHTNTHTNTSTQTHAHTHTHTRASNIGTAVQYSKNTKRNEMLLQKQNCNEQYLLLSDKKLEFGANKIGVYYKLNLFEPDFLQIRYLLLLLYRT
jgi:hypothetical protein